MRHIVKRAAAALLLLLVLGGAGLVRALKTGRADAGAVVGVPTAALTEAAESLSLPVQLALLGAKAPDEKLLMPVRGVKVRQVADTWGAPRDGGRAHAGQDIFARRSTPVYSATEGYVVGVGESQRGGKTVFVFGPGGRHYYYAHLDAHAEGLAAGDYVTPETLLGYVGTTGNAAGTPPHLHFGVYAATGAINPLPLLADRG